MPNYSTCNDTDANFFDNFKFWDTGNNLAGKPSGSGNRYRYDYGGGLLYWRDTQILGDTVSVKYKVTGNFSPAVNGGVTYPSKGDTVIIPWSMNNNNGNDFIHAYYKTDVTANIVHADPTSDFYFDGNTSVQKGSTIQAVDGSSSGSYADTTSKYWSVYRDSSDTLHFHSGAGATKQSFAYDNAVITSSTWIVTNASGSDITSSCVSGSTNPLTLHK